MSYLYPIALLLISAFVAALERLRPWRTQKQLRPMLWSDLVHLVFNGHFLGVLIYGLATSWVLPPIDRLLGQHGLTTHVYRNLATTWPLWLQVVVVILVLDFVQWCVHNLLHRVSWLWEFHKVHHSVVDGEMDWIVSFRFQFVEVLVYKSFQYLPLAFFGFRPESILIHAIFGTLIGHLNHANLDFTYGPLRYVLNSPRMHLWHHYYEGDSKTTINYGIILSVWDWIFRTGHIPKDPPPKLGFPGVEDFPKDFFSQTIWPLQRLLPASLRRGYLPAALGLLTLTGFYFAHLPPQKKVPANLALAGESLAASQPTLTEQPAGTYARDAAEADAALLRFGEEARAAGYAHPEHLVSVSELAHALGSRRLVLLDLRPGDRATAGRIPQAQTISPADYIEQEPLPGLLRARAHLQGLLRSRGVKEDSVVVLYGDGGPEAFRFFWALQAMGPLAARVLDGGLLAWKAAGHPVAGGPPRAAAPGEVTLRGQASEVPLRWAQIEAFMKEGKDGQGALLLDGRSKDEYTGARQHPEAARGGHIPGAVNIEWTQMVRGEKDARLLPPAALRARFAPHQVEQRARIITTCQSGNRSAALYFALLQIGVPQDRILNYNGSWAEYSRLSLPLHTGDQP